MGNIREELPARKLQRNNGPITNKEFKPDETQKNKIKRTSIETRNY